MGKIAEADFTEMVDRLRNRAIGLLRQLDQHQPEWREQIERELARRLAARPHVTTGGRPVAGSRGADVGAGVICACGTANDADARFCKQCGSSLVASSSEGSADPHGARSRS
jgi:hypothetical protein